MTKAQPKKDLMHPSENMGSGDVIHLPRGKTIR